MTYLFQSTIARNRWFNIAMASIFDVIIATILVYFFADTYTNKLVAVVFVTLGIWAIEIAIALKIVLFKVASYYLWRKRTWVGSIKFQLRQYDLPLPDETDISLRYGSGLDYLKAMHDDVRLTPEARLYAGVSLGEAGAVRQYSLIDALQFNAVLDQALGEHFAYTMNGQR